MRAVAAAQLALIFPAALFLAAVCVGIGDPPQYDLAVFARALVKWYAARMWTLWVLLLALPLAVLLAGCAAIATRWKDEGVPTTFPTLLVAGTTMVSACILAIVVLHMAAN